MNDVRICKSEEMLGFAGSGDDNYINVQGEENAKKCPRSQERIFSNGNNLFDVPWMKEF